MEVSDTHLPETDFLHAAKARIRNGPVPAWVQPTPFSIQFRSEHTDSATSLLLSRQIHAELHQTHVRTVQRLENMQGVQEFSQWRLPFEPLTTSVTLHWIKICRGDSEGDQSSVDRFLVVQHEDRFEGWMLNGWVTLLLVLEDVRP